MTGVERGSTVNKRPRRIGDTENEIGTKQINAAYEWWKYSLKNAKWIKYSDSLTGENVFVPCQYITESLNHDDNDEMINLTDKEIARRVRKKVMELGTPGIHFAVGWEQLYYLVKKFGTLRAEDENQRKHTRVGYFTSLPTVESYKGPRLFETGCDSPASTRTDFAIPRKRLSPLKSFIQEDKIARSKMKVKALLKATVPVKNPTKVEVNANKTMTISQKSECGENSLGQDSKLTIEEQHEERCRRLAMQGFWESRRIGLPRIYYEKFPEGFEKAFA